MTVIHLSEESFRSHVRHEGMRGMSVTAMKETMDIAKIVIDKLAEYHRGLSSTVYYTCSRTTYLFTWTFAYSTEKEETIADNIVRAVQDEYIKKDIINDDCRYNKTEARVLRMMSVECACPFKDKT